MTKYERAKLWVKNNQEGILIVGFGTAFVGLLLVGIKSNMKYQEQMNSELNSYIDELNALHHAKELL